jgi:hypothetical protein
LVLLCSCRFNEFGFDGGLAAKSALLKPKFNLFLEQASANIGMVVPHIEV